MLKNQLWEILTGLVLIADGFIRIITLGFVKANGLNAVAVVRTLERTPLNADLDEAYLHAEQPVCMFFTGKKK